MNILQSLIFNIYRNNILFFIFVNMFDFSSHSSCWLHTIIITVNINEYILYFWGFWLKLRVLKFFYFVIIRFRKRQLTYWFTNDFYDFFSMSSPLRAIEILRSLILSVQVFGRKYNVIGTKKNTFNWNI